MLPPPFARVRCTSTCCDSLRCRGCVCDGVGCVVALLRIASWGPCWPSPSRLARRGKGGPTPIGVCPPIAVSDADVRTTSSAATSIAVGSASTIGVPSLTLHFPFPRFRAPPLFFDIYSRPQRGLYSCRTNNTEKKTKRTTRLLGRGRHRELTFLSLHMY